MYNKKMTNRTIALSGKLLENFFLRLYKYHLNIINQIENKLFCDK